MEASALKTSTIRFLKPMNEGVDIASCDSVDGRAVECIA